MMTLDAVMVAKFIVSKKLLVYCNGGLVTRFEMPVDMRVRGCVLIRQIHQEVQLNIVELKAALSAASNFFITDCRSLHSGEVKSNTVSQ